MWIYQLRMKWPFSWYRRCVIMKHPTKVGARKVGARKAVVMYSQSVRSAVIPGWLPWAVKIVGTIYLLEAPAILVLRALVLMFVPSKIEWLETFHGIQMRTWAVVLAAAAITHLASGGAGWVIGVRLARRRPRALRHWQLLAGWLLVQHLAWSIWIVLAFQEETRYLLFTLLQGVLLLVLAIYSWCGVTLAERNNDEENPNLAIH